MILSQAIIGIVNIIFGLAVAIFRDYISQSHLFTIPKGFGGKSLEEKFGEVKSRKLILIFGLFILAAGCLFLIAGLFDIPLASR